MRRLSWPLIPTLVAAIAVGCPVFAQQPASPPPSDEGFFRPTPPPAPSDASLPAQGASMPGENEVSSLAAEKAALAAERAALATERAAFQARIDSLERDLDRSRREHDQAQVQAARRPAPLIVSPLDGTAPIVSPLDRFP